MPVLTDPATLLLLAGAAGMALALAVLAAVLLGHGAEERDLSNRMRAVLRPAEAGATSRPPGGFGAGLGAGVGAGLVKPLQRLGEFLRDHAIISEKEVAGFQRDIAAAGLDPRRAVPIFLGAKAVLLFGLPLLAVAAALFLDMERMDGIKLGLAALALGVLAPNWVIGMIRRPFQERLRNGLPDALDLLVVEAEAGLGLETGLDRVAREMEGSNRAIAMELKLLVQELRMLPDRRVALERMVERSELEGLKRLGSTLSQALRYGTPLAQALRILASDMRQERMLRIEEKAIRLPAMLIGPLILFILPALFIALIGPSIIELGNSFGAAP